MLINRNRNSIFRNRYRIYFRRKHYINMTIAHHNNCMNRSKIHFILFIFEKYTMKFDMMLKPDIYHNVFFITIDCSVRDNDMSSKELLCVVNLQHVVRNSSDISTALAISVWRYRRPFVGFSGLGLPRLELHINHICGAHKKLPFTGNKIKNYHPLGKIYVVLIYVDFHQHAKPE